MIGRTLTTATLSAALALGLLVQPARAGLLQAIDTAMKNYAANIVKQGEQATNDVKNGSIKNFYNDAFVNYSKSFYEEGMLGGDALKDSKAIFAEIKKIVMWVPNKIKEIWAKIIDALRYVRDRIGAAGPGWPPPNAGGAAPAAEPVSAVSASPAEDLPAVPTEGEAKASAGLGDGFLGRFSTTRDFSRKMTTFVAYQTQVAGAKSWYAGLKPQEQKALAPNLSRVLAEAGELEDLFSRDVAGEGFDAFVKAAAGMDAKTARSTIRGLLQKVSQRLNMRYLGNKSDKVNARKVQQLAALKTRLGL